MKVLYVVGNGSLNDNAELRYSLRMRDAHGSGIDEVIVCGDVPDFVGGKATIIHEHDICPLGKHWNMTHKIIAAIRKLDLKEDVLISCDDHFLFRDADMDKWPRYNSGDIYGYNEFVASYGHEPGRYQKSIIATRLLLEKYGLPIINCVRHVDMHIDCRLVDEVEEMIELHKDWSEYGFEPMLVFNNLAINKKMVSADDYIKFGQDVKCKSFGEVEQILQSKCRNMFSVDDSAFNGGNLMRWLKKHYPEKSRWEK